MTDVVEKLREVSRYGMLSDEAAAEIVHLRYQIEWILDKVIFPLAMIDRDNMTEHDEALLEEAIERAKEIYHEPRRT
jgi:hypothetical protein